MRGLKTSPPLEGLGEAFFSVGFYHGSFFRLIQGINRSVIRQSIILIVKLMSFKTSVLIWFSRFRGTQPHPNLTGWGFCVRQRNIGLQDRVTNEHKGMVT